MEGNTTQIEGQRQSIEMNEFKQKTIPQVNKPIPVPLYNIQPQYVQPVPQSQYNNVQPQYNVQPVPIPVPASQVNVTVGNINKNTSKKFKYHFCNCCSDGYATFLVASCGGCCCLDATTRRNMDNSNVCFNCCCLGPPATRNIIRENYDIDGNCCSDVCISCCFPLCNTVQLSSEVRYRTDPDNNF